jgi:hypothetical protein
LAVKGCGDAGYTLFRSGSFRASLAVARPLQSAACH